MFLEDKQMGWKWSWSFILVPEDGRTRLISMSRSYVPRRLATILMWAAIEIPAFIMTRKMLLNLRHRAEGLARTRGRRPSVLSAYESVRWRIRLSPGTKVVGAVLGGYHAPDGIDGLAADTPVLTRVADYGEKYLYDYPGRTARGPGVVERVRELTGRAPASFQGAEKGERYRIGPPTAR